MLRPTFRVLQPGFPDRCEMTFADIDVTPLVAREFQKQLQERMREALMTLAPRLNAIRRQVDRNWLLLQQPVKLWENQWLLLNPRGVALSPLLGHGNRVDAKLAVLMWPQMVTGPVSDSSPRPLPPLTRFYPHSSGLNLWLDVDLDFAALNRALDRRLSGESMDIRGRRVILESVEVGGQGQNIHVNARLGGDAAGSVELKADMIFSPETQQLKIENLAYVYNPDDPWLQAEAGLFYGYIRKLLAAAANRELEERVGQGRQQLQSLFESIIPDDVRLDMASLRLHQVQLDVAEDAIRLHGLASGHVVLEFR